MDPDVAFGVKLRGLLDTLHAFDFGEEFVEEAGFMEEFEAAAGSAFGEDAGEFVALAFGGDGVDLRGEFADGVEGVRFNGEVKAGGEADGAEHAEVVLFEAAVRRADGADHAVFEVGASADVVEDLAGHGVEEEGVDGEVAAENIFGRICFKHDGVGMPPVGVGAFAAEGGDFGREGAGADEDDAEVSADEFGVGGGSGGGRRGVHLEDLDHFIGAGVGDDIEILGGAAE